MTFPTLKSQRLLWTDKERLTSDASDEICHECTNKNYKTAQKGVSCLLLAFLLFGWEGMMPRKCGKLFYL
jgi:hypothetical protein